MLRRTSSDREAVVYVQANAGSQTARHEQQEHESAPCIQLAEGQWRGKLASRVIGNQRIALRQLDVGVCKGLSQQVVFESKSCADCRIECERAIIWVEGKRFDWLSPSTTWDVTRDQLARNLEAAWLVAKDKGKEYCVIVCHEYPLKHHEKLLIDRYQKFAWIGGWPHISTKQRMDFARRIGTVTWHRLANRWPGIRDMRELSDLEG